MKRKGKSCDLVITTCACISSSPAAHHLLHLACRFRWGICKRAPQVINKELLGFKHTADEFHQVRMMHDTHAGAGKRERKRERESVCVCKSVCFMCLELSTDCCCCCCPFPIVLSSSIPPSLSLLRYPHLPIITARVPPSLIHGLCLMQGDTERDEGELMSAWLLNPVRDWTTDQLVTWAKDLQLDSCVDGITRYRLKGKVCVCVCVCASKSKRESETETETESTCWRVLVRHVAQEDCQTSKPLLLTSQPRPWFLLPVLLLPFFYLV